MSADLNPYGAYSVAPANSLRIFEMPEPALAEPDADQVHCAGVKSRPCVEVRHLTFRAIGGLLRRRPGGQLSSARRLFGGAW